MLLIGALLCLGNATVRGQARPTEYDVKAAYVFNFGQFIRLSVAGSQRDDFDICVLGTDPIVHSLDALAKGEQIDSRPVRIRRLREVSEARSCDVAYLSAAEDTRLGPELAELRSADVLTVSDAPDFLTKGGMIQFVTASSHVRFSVNLEAVHRTHLVLSSELLRVALSVTGRPGGETQP